MLHEPQTVLPPIFDFLRVCLGGSGGSPALVLIAYAFLTIASLCNTPLLEREVLQGDAMARNA